MVETHNCSLSARKSQLFSSITLLALVVLPFDCLFGTVSDKVDPADRNEFEMNAGLPGLALPAGKPRAHHHAAEQHRLRKKHLGNINHAKNVIAKGERMMRSSPKHHKDYKKGQVFKESGEKWLAELKSHGHRTSESVHTGTETKK